MQLQFNLPEIDRDRTKEAVEQASETCRLYSLQVSLDRPPSITASYSFTPPSPRLPSSSTEQATIANIDYEQARLKYINWVANAVNHLCKTKRMIIHKHYLQDTELNMSERNYYRLKLVCSISWPLH